MPALSTNDFKVADLGLAEFGRKEIRLAEHEMPGLMAMRREFGTTKPLTGSDSKPRAFAHGRRQNAAEMRRRAPRKEEPARATSTANDQPVTCVQALCHAL